MDAFFSFARTKIYKYTRDIIEVTTQSEVFITQNNKHKIRLSHTQMLFQLHYIFTSFKDYLQPPILIIHMV